MNKKTVRFSTPLEIKNDRFIPSLDHKQMEVVQYLLSESAKEKEKRYDTPYDSALSQLLFGKDITIPENRSNIFSRNPISRRTRKRKYKIAHNLIPDSILSLPLPFDDYYPNIFDYSSLDIVASSVLNELYFMSIKRDDKYNLYEKDIVIIPNEKEITCISFSNQNPNLLACGFIDGRIDIIDIQKDKKINSFVINYGRYGIISISWYKDLIMVVRYNYLLIIDIMTGKTITVIREKNDERILKAAFSPDGQYIGILNNNYQFTLKHIDSLDNDFLISGIDNGTIQELKGIKNYDFTWSKYNKNKTLVLSGTKIINIRVENRTFRILNSIEAVNRPISSIVLAKNSEFLIGSEGQNILIWEFPSLLLLDKINLDYDILKLLMDENEDLLFAITKNEQLNTIKLFEPINKN